MEESDFIQQRDDDDGQIRSTRWRRAIVISFMFHLGLAVILMLTIPKWYRVDQAGAASKAENAAGSPEPGERRRSPAPPTEPEPSPTVPDEQITKSVEQQVDQAQRLPPEQQLTELERNLQRLERISSEDSVSQVNQTIANSIGLDSQQYADRESPAEGDINLDEAQIRDVFRRQTADGRWQYESVLVDTQGRTMTVPLSAEEGETLYATFETMKQYPFAQGIYQDVVMPMLQSMTETAEVTSERTELIQDEQQTAVDDVPPSQ